jgi:predicted amidohydrolase
MKICIAQTEPIKGNVSANIEAHKKFIELALTLQANAIFFPELSLTGYEPELATKLAIQLNDIRLNIFQQISNEHQIIIGIGLPTSNNFQIHISMMIFEPNKARQVYSKQYLHSDELPYFKQGMEQVVIKTDHCTMVPAICFESLLPTHAENAFKLGADIYLASVAKPENGVVKAFKHYPAIAKQYSMAVLMSNCVGFCDNFLSDGRSSVWSKKGKLVGQLDRKTEGVLMFDTETEEVMERTIGYNRNQL